MPDTPEDFEDLPADQQLKMAREKARKMLDGLIEAKRATEQRARAEGHIGQPGYVTSRHAMDQAIASTRRMLEALEGLIAEMGNNQPPPQDREGEG